MKFVRHYLSILTSTLLAFTLITLPVLAADSAEPDPAESPTGLLFRWLNFILVFGAIAYLLAKHGGAFFRSNAKDISTNIREATAAKAEADRELSAAESKVSQLARELSEMREEARKNWAVESERLRNSGLAEVEKINQAAKVELAASERAAQHELRDAAAVLSVQNAAALVSAKMNPEVRERLFRTFLDELGRSSN